MWLVFDGLRESTSFQRLLGKVAALLFERDCMFKLYGPVNCAMALKLHPEIVRSFTTIDFRMAFMWW